MDFVRWYFLQNPYFRYFKVTRLADCWNLCVHHAIRLWQNKLQILTFKNINCNIMIQKTSNLATFLENILCKIKTPNWNKRKEIERHASHNSWDFLLHQLCKRQLFSQKFNWWLKIFTSFFMSFQMGF